MSLHTQWRIAQCFVHITVWMLFSCFGMMIMMVFTPKSWYHTLFTAILVLFACMFATFGIAYRFRSRVEAAITQMRWQCCPRCMYDLSKQERLPDSPGSIRCPECGEVTGWESMRNFWKSKFHPHPSLRKHWEKWGG